MIMGALDGIYEDAATMADRDWTRVEPWNRFRLVRARMMLHDVRWFLEHRRTPESVTKNPTGMRVDLDTHHAVEDELSIPGYSVGYEARKSLMQLQEDALIVARAINAGSTLPEWAEAHVFSAYVDVDQVQQQAAPDVT